MKLSVTPLQYTLIAATLASSFEPADFNVTEALIKNGVDVSSVPGLTGLSKRSSTGKCSFAVCFMLRTLKSASRHMTNQPHSAIASSISLETAVYFSRTLPHMKPLLVHTGQLNKLKSSPSACSSPQLPFRSRPLSCFLDLRNVLLL
jgi:hypothetical protein